MLYTRDSAIAGYKKAGTAEQKTLHTMSIIESIALLGIMVALAAMPSTSVALVVTRAATLGVKNGLSLIHI